MPATPAEIARRALTDHLAALPPAELLKRYANRRDPEAFAGLVQQFGPMVLGTCRRVLGASADVDDAFQAVFLSLARQADSFRDPAALPAWLHRVSLRVAHKALARRAPASEPPEAIPDPADPLADVAWKDVRRVLDEELDRLPDKYRGPVVLCWLDGLTQDEAARRLGTSLATLKRRLDAGRELLRARLVRRGLAPVLAAAAVADPTGLRAVVPEALAALAVEHGVLGTAVPAGVEGLRVAVAVGAPGRGYLKVALALALVVGSASAGVLGRSEVRPEEPPGTAPAVVGAENDWPAPPLAEGEPPLPPGAVVRMGKGGAVLSGDGLVLARRTEAGTIEVWDVKGGRRRTRIETPLGVAAISSDGDLILCGWGEFVTVLRTWDGSKVAEFPRPPEGDTHFPIGFGPGGRTLLLPELNSTHVCKIDLTSPERIERVALAGAFDLFTKLTAGAHRLVVGTPNGIAEVDVDRMTVTYLTGTKPPRGENSYQPCSISEDGGLVCIRWRDDQLLVYNVRQQAPLTTLPGTWGILSRDGGRVLVSAGNGWELIDLRSGQRLADLELHREFPFPNGGSPFVQGGRSLIAVAKDGYLYRWDIERLIAAQKK